MQDKKRLLEEMNKEREKFESDKGRLVQENTKLHQMAVVEHQQNLKSAEVGVVNYPCPQLSIDCIFSWFRIVLLNWNIRCMSWNKKRNDS